MLLRYRCGAQSYVSFPRHKFYCFQSKRTQDSLSFKNFGDSIFMKGLVISNRGVSPNFDSQESLYEVFVLFYGICMCAHVHMHMHTPAWKS